jgi:hypothetical protein
MNTLYFFATAIALFGTGIAAAVGVIFLVGIFFADTIVEAQTRSY